MPFTRRKNSLKWRFDKKGGLMRTVTTNSREGDPAAVESRGRGSWPKAGEA